MKKILSLMLAVLTILTVFSFSTTAFADKHPDGWAYESDGKQNNWYYYVDGMPLSEGIYEIDGKGYYFNYQGVMQTGWVYDDASYTDENGKYVTQYIWYYAGSNGVLSEGWKSIGNVWYYFEPEAYHMYANGMYNIGNRAYVFTKSGAMRTGWISVDFSYYEGDDTVTIWFYADTNGALVKGWKQIGGKWYYFDPTDYWMYSNAAEKINGKVYFFTSSGAMLAGGWGKDSCGDWYYADANGALATGWKQIGGKWYYFDLEEGFMFIGGHEIGDKVYLFDGSGAWIKPSGTGWKQVKYTYTYSGKTYTYTDWFYFKNSKIVTGWEKISGKWYYFQFNGSMLSGTVAQGNDGKVYFLNNDGSMRTATGWVSEVYEEGATDWYYINNSSGECAKGWKLINGKKYYFDQEWAYMRTGFQAINGNWYYFKDSGEMVTGSQTINGKPYVFDSNGVMISGEIPGAVG